MMPITGHPDYQGYAQWRGDIIVANPAFSLKNTTPFHVEAIVTQWASLTLNVDTALAAGATVTATFWTDATAVVQTAQLQWIINVVSDLEVQIPILGNFITFDVSTTSAVAGNLSITCIPSNIVVSGSRYWVLRNTVHNTALSIAASGTKTDIMPHIAEGPGYMYFRNRENNANVTVGLFLVNADSTLGDRIFFEATTGPVLNLSFLGARHGIAIQIANNDGAAAHTVDYWVALDGR